MVMLVLYVLHFTILLINYLFMYYIKIYYFILLFIYKVFKCIVRLFCDFMISIVKFLYYRRKGSSLYVYFKENNIIINLYLKYTFNV